MEDRTRSAAPSMPGLRLAAKPAWPERAPARRRRARMPATRRRPVRICAKWESGAADQAASCPRARRFASLPSFNASPRKAASPAGTRCAAPTSAGARAKAVFRGVEASEASSGTGPYRRCGFVTPQRRPPLPRRRPTRSRNASPWAGDEEEDRRGIARLSRIIILTCRAFSAWPGLSCPSKLSGRTPSFRARRCGVARIVGQARP